MREILSLLLKSKSFILYKKALALVLAFIMLFNLTSEVFANLPQIIKENQQVSNQLQAELTKIHQEQESPSSSKAKTLFEKMQEAQIDYAIALAKYETASQLVYFPDTLERVYNNIIGKFEQVKNNLDIEEKKIDAELEAPSLKQYKAAGLSYLRWKSQENNYKEQIKKLEGDILNQEQKNSRGKRKEAKKNELIQETQAKIEELQNKINQGNEKWKWYEEEETYISDVLNPRIDNYKKAVENHNAAINNYEQDIELYGTKMTYNKILDSWYGGQSVPKGMKLEKGDKIEDIQKKYDVLIEKLDLLEQEYNRAARRYVAAANAYYDDLLLRYQTFEKKQNDAQCKSIQQIYNQRQEAKEALDSSGWSIISKLNDDQLKNTSNEGIRRSLMWTWNICATGKVWINADTLDKLYKNETGVKINPEEYIKMKFLEYYEEYIPENQKSYQNRAVSHDDTYSIDYAYNFKVDEGKIKKDGKKRGRELFILLLADYELGYAKYRASFMDSKLAKMLYDYIGNIYDTEENIYEEDGTVKIKGYNLPKKYYDLYIKDYDSQFKKIEKNMFSLVNRTEIAARSEVHRLAGSLVKKMYEGKSIKEALRDEGITQDDIKAVYNKYKDEFDPKTINNKKAQLKRELENRDYSGIINYDVTSQFKLSTGEKIIEGLFAWLPSTWLGLAHRIERMQEEYDRRLTYANIHESQTFKNMLYVLSENSASWKSYLIPLARKIKEEGKDVETASLLADLSTTQSDIDIKDLAISTERAVQYKLQDDPFFIAKQMLIDLITTAGIAMAFDTINSLRAARQSINVAKMQRIAVKNTRVASQAGKTAKINSFNKRTKIAKVKQGRNTGLDKVKNKIKAEKQQSRMQSLRDKANYSQQKASDKYLRKVQKRHQQEMDQEAKEISDYIEARQGTPKTEPKQLSWIDNLKMNAGYAWDQIKGTISAVAKSPKIAAMAGSGLGGEIAPAIVVEQTIADNAAKETTYELIAEANNIAKESSVAQDGLEAVKNSKNVSKTAAETFFDYTAYYRNAHLAPSLEPVSGGGTFRSGFNQNHINSFAFASGLAGEKSYRQELLTDIKKIAAAAYKDLTSEEIDGYIEQGQEMYKNNEAPRIGIHHPITILAYEQAKEKAQIKILNDEIKAEVFSHFTDKVHKVAAISFMPIINLLFPKFAHYLTGGAPLLNAEQADAISAAIDQASEEISAKISPEDENFKLKVIQRAQELLQGSQSFNGSQKMRLARILSKYAKRGAKAAKKETKLMLSEEDTPYIVADESLPKGQGDIYTIQDSSKITLQFTENQDGSITYYNYVPVYLQVDEETVSDEPVIYLKIYGDNTVTIPAGFKLALQEDGSIKYFVNDIEVAGVNKALKNNGKVADIELSLTLEDMQNLKAYLLNNPEKTAVININKKDALRLFSGMLAFIAGADLGASLSSQLKGTFGLVSIAIAISGFGYLSPLLANLFKPLIQKYGKKKMIQLGLLAMAAVSILGVCAGMYGTYKLDVSDPGSWQFLSGVVFFITAITVASLFSTLASPMLSVAYPNKSVFASKNLVFTTIKGLSRMLVTFIPAMVGLFTSGVNWSLLTPGIGLLSVAALIALNFIRDIDPQNTAKKETATSKELKNKYKEVFTPKTKEITRRLGQIYMAYGIITSVVIGVVSGILYSPTQALWFGLIGSALNFTARMFANKLLKAKKINNDQLTGFLLPVMAVSIASLLFTPYGYMMLIPWYLTQISTSTFGVAENTRMMTVVSDYYKEKKAEVQNNETLKAEERDKLIDQLTKEEENMKLIAANKYNVRNSFGIFPILVTIALMSIFIDAGIGTGLLESLSAMPLFTSQNTLNIIRIAILFPAIVSTVLMYQNREMIKNAWKYVLGKKEDLGVSKDRIMKHYGKALVYEMAMRNLLTKEITPEVKNTFEKYYKEATKELNSCGQGDEKVNQMLFRLETLKANMNAMSGSSGINIENTDTDDEGFISQIQSYIKDSNQKDNSEELSAN